MDGNKSGRERNKYIVQVNQALEAGYFNIEIFIYEFERSKQVMPRQGCCGITPL